MDYDNSILLFVHLLIVGLDVHLPMHELLVQLVYTLAPSDHIGQSLPIQLFLLPLQDQEVLRILLRVVMLRSRYYHHSLYSTIDLRRMLQLLRCPVAVSTALLLEVFGQVQFFQQNIGDFFIESSVEEELNLVGLQERLDERNIIDLFILDAIVDGPSPKQPLQAVECLIKTTAFDLELDEAFLPCIGHLHEDVGRLDGDEYLGLIDTPALPTTVLLDAALPLMAGPLHAHHTEDEQGEEDRENKKHPHTIRSLLL
jgi:hypothetical protein